MAATANSFVIQPKAPGTPSLASSALKMGLFDAFSKAFSNDEFSAPPEGVKATARHILVKDMEQVKLVRNELEGGAGFN
eukprot:CAMPEP_0197240942 /NCGR_PEP_ID=MMETSP1429-20130617/7121_1 /TAXON_ID=49237 /ORGANISM="Chaetoceros  sp., Strain UNC1202" /LENGTH=78 /DNA_ID=CAMNT_0042700695 /DNA_START=15 /DNA_END=248 /DNA_ORIENTATION=+